jgi:hypothetical protein
VGFLPLHALRGGLRAASFFVVFFPKIFYIELYNEERKNGGILYSLGYCFVRRLVLADNKDIQ